MEKISNKFITDTAEDYNCKCSDLELLFTLDPKTILDITTLYYSVSMPSTMSRFLKLMVEIYNNKIEDFDKIYTVAKSERDCDKLCEKLKPMIGSINSQFISYSVDSEDMKIIRSFIDKPRSVFKDIIKVFGMFFNVKDSTFDMLDEVCEYRNIDLTPLLG